jgi:hypothetical protein
MLVPDLVGSEVGVEKFDRLEEIGKTLVFFVDLQELPAIRVVSRQDVVDGLVVDYIQAISEVLDCPLP